MGLTLALMGTFVAGAVFGVGVVRYGMGLGERMAYGAKDGYPALSEYDTPVEQTHTSNDELES